MLFQKRANKRQQRKQIRRRLGQIETLERRQLLAADLLFADSFESGSNSNDWSGNWVEDSQNDWFRSTQRATDGNRSAEVDGWASNATLRLSNPIDLSSYDSATLTFDWLIESGFDSGEYIALDISSDGGATWSTSVRQLNGNSDPENQWRSESVDLTPYASSNLIIQFRAKASRSNEDANLDNVKITGEQSAPSFPATISYPDFSDSTGLALMGSAGIAGGNTLRLTPAASGLNGAAWHSDKQFVSVDWETSFDFNLNENFGDVGGSDGFTFVIQNHAPTYLAGGGGTLGYDALPNSLVVEFDTFLNTESGDPGQSHISVHTGGNGPNGSDESLSIGSYVTPEIMDDATTHNVTIRYVSGELQVFYDGSLTPVITASVDLSELLDLDGGKAWVGFTAATGGGYQNHDILNWDYRPLVDVSSTVGVGSAEVVEGDTGTSTLVFDIVREGNTSGPATVDWSLLAGSATAGTDYANASGTVSFAAGQTSQPVTVQIVGDSAEEDHETLTLQLANLSTGVLVVDQAVGTILNDDTSISVSDVTVTESDGTLKSLGNFVSEGSGGLTRPRLLQFGADASGDGVEDLYVASVDTNEILRYDGVTGDFVDAFVTGQPELSNPIGLAFSPVSGDLYAVSGSNVVRFDGSTGDFVETVASGLQSPAGVSFFESGPRFGQLLITERGTDKVLIHDGTTLSDFVQAGSGGLDNPRNAVVGADGDVYVASRDTLQVLKYSGTDGQFDSVVADIPLNSVAYIEFGEDGLLYVTGKTNEACCDNTLIQLDVTSGEILQTLPLENVGWSFTVGPNDVIYSAGNGFGNGVELIGRASNVDFNLQLSKPSALPVTVDFATAGSSATEGIDYLATSGNITFEPGVSSRAVLVSTLDDELTENDEDFALNLSNAVGADLATASATGTIQDDGDLSNLPPTVDAGSDQVLSDSDGSGSESVTLVGTASDSDGSIASVEWTLGAMVLGTANTLTTSLPIGSYTLTFTATDDGGLSSSDTVDVTVEAAENRPKLSHGNVPSVGSSWQTVNLGKSYTSAVVVATPRYNTGSGPGVVRVSNVTADSFDVRVDSVGTTAFSGGVHFIAMEEGVYDVPGEYKLEAVKVDASTTSGKTGGWQIGSQSYQQSYSSPVVVGQVMSTNDEDWSVFWSSSSSRTSPATASALNVGKHVGEDSDAARATETLGYFVIESTGSGSIDGLSFSAGVGNDTIRGVGNGTYQYSGVTPGGAATAVLGSTGMDGGDGGWAVLSGDTPLASGNIAMSIDEDQLRDTERNHTTEQVAYFVIGGPVGEGEASHTAAPEITIHDPLDVNGDGFTSPIDVLQVINALNVDSSTQRLLEEGDNALDTNGDGHISPIDALLVINRLNAESESAASTPDSTQAIDGYFGDLEDEEEAFFRAGLVG